MEAYPTDVAYRSLDIYVYFSFLPKVEVLDRKWPLHEIHSNLCGSDTAALSSGHQSRLLAYVVRVVYA